MKKNVFVVLFLTTLQLSLFSQKSNADKKFAWIDTTISRILREWHASGCALAIVDNRKILYAKGFGFKDWTKKIPATENTLFPIGSCSKAFTATLMGMLVKDGKLDLDKPVHDYLPELKFYNETLTNNVTTRDMMCHRTGLPRHDYSWYGSTTSRDSLVYRIRFLEPSAALREKWQYNNFMFVAQGVLAEKLYGKKWETLVKEKIFEPLGMINSNFSIVDLQKAPDYTFGYREQKDSVVKMDYMNIDPIGPAGSINSTVKEMANWVITWINGGKFNNKEVIPASYVAQATASQMVIGSGIPFKEVADIQFSDYGLAWFLSSYRGHYLVQHGGNIDGFSANTAFFPTDSIGIIVLVNQNASALPGLIRNLIADRLLALPYRNWNKLQKDAVSKMKSASLQKINADSVNRKPNTRPSHELSQYAGRYENPGYGVAGVELKRDTLWVSYNQSNGKLYLSHYHYDIFNIRSTEDSDPVNGENPKIRFITDNQGEIGSFETSLEPAVKDIVFARLPPAVLVTKDELQKYIGDYDLLGITVKVYIRGENTLMVLVPGQPDYELVPTKTHEFDFKVIKGYSVKFEANEKNEITALSFNQPNGIFKASRKK